LNESPSAAFAQSGHVCVIVDQPRRIDIIEGALDQIAGLDAHLFAQLFKACGKSARDVMEKAH